MVTAPSPTRDAPSPTRSAPSSWPRVAVMTLALVGAIMTLLVAFALPGIESGLHDVPVAVVGPAQQTAALTERLEAAAPGGFEVRVLTSAEQAREQILDREVYGALIVGDSGVTLEVASAASPTMATALTQAVTSLGEAASIPVQVEDVRPFPADDPKGVGLSTGAVPLALGGWIAAVGIMAGVRGARQRLLTGAGFAVFGGLGLVAILQYWFGTIDGSYWLTSLGAMLGAGAACFAVLGLQRMFGKVGLGLAVIALILLGSPLSGLTSAPELLPAPWGAIGQFLPPGATGTLLRNLALFDGAATTVPILVLAGWLLAGLALFGAGTLRGRRRTPGPATEESAAPTD
ncbi:MAG: ABC transporter permease [Cellulomonas sp.]|nr:ABC transporter permease [Cellulomonas sp.]